MYLYKIETESKSNQLLEEFDFVYKFDLTYVCISNEKLENVPSHANIERFVETSKRVYFIVQKGGSFENENPDIETLISFGRYLFVALDDKEQHTLTCHNNVCWQMEKLVRFKEVYSRVKPDLNRKSSRFQTFTIDKKRLEEHMVKLCQYFNRFTFEDSFFDAANYCKSYFEELNYETNLQEFDVNYKSEIKPTVNVIARKAGRSANAKTFIICGHLDSINKDGVGLKAPGADDNATGSTGVLEMAYQLASKNHLHNVIFILFGAEEIGLYGSKYYVSQLAAEDELLGIINMDMIGRKNGDNYGVLLEGHEISREMTIKLSHFAADYTSLDVAISFNPYASDHIPFIEKGYPALLTIEASDSSNRDIHTERDQLHLVDYKLMSQILRANLMCSDYYLNKQ